MQSQTTIGPGSLPTPDSCYLCEVGKEGLVVPAGDQELLICIKCVLECIWANPRMYYELLKKNQRDLEARMKGQQV